MGIVRKQSSWTALIIYLGIGLGYINTMYMFPEFMKPKDLGLRTALVDFSMLFSQLSMLGFGAVINKYYPIYNPQGKKNRGFLFFVTVVPVIGFIVIAAILFFFRAEVAAWFQNDESRAFQKNFMLVFPLSFFFMLMLLMESYMKSLKKVVVNSVIREVVVRVASILLVGLYALNIVDEGFFWYYFVSIYAIAAFILFVYIVSIRELYFKVDFSMFKQVETSKIFTYALYVFLAGWAGMMVVKIDSLMITSKLGESSTGVYTIALFMATVIEIPKRALTQIGIPIISEAWSKDNRTELQSIYTKSSINQLIVGGLVFLLIWMNVDSIFLLIPDSKEYVAGKYVVLFLGAGKLIHMSAGLNVEIISYSKKYRFSLYSSVFLAALTFLTNSWLIPMYGITGAALATAISLFIYNFISFLFVWINFKLQPFSIQSVVVIIIGLFTFFILSYIPDLPNVILSILVKGMLITTIFGGAVLALKVSPDINQFVRQIFQRIFK